MVLLNPLFLNRLCYYHNNVSLFLSINWQLYEQVVLELIEARDIELAREVLRSTEPFAVMKQLELPRYMRLEQLCGQPYYNATDAYAMGRY